MKRALYLPATYLVLALVFSLASCTSDSSKKQEKNVEDAAGKKIDEKVLEDFNKSKLIFYSLPSPLETAMLIKRAGATYDEDLLNPLENIEKYNTNLKKALNLGVYSADLSYTSLFDQTQSSVKYMANAKKLADGLGILNAIDENTIKKLENNMNNRDVVLDIISETFMNSNAYLTEENRPVMAVSVLIGGWTEGLYIATKLTNGSLTNNKKLIERIVYQKLSLYTILNLLESFKGNEDADYLRSKMEELKVIFDQVKIKNTSKVEATTDEKNKITTIKADSEVDISPEVFEKLLKKVAEIRAEFIA
ncbi:MAG: hypothetical protein GXO47_14220 [Chlorobi bacterium]|nr:hypothetical protein [Chlorobiota bacterium]